MGEFLFLCQSHRDDILTLYTILNSTDFYSLLVLGNEPQTVLELGKASSNTPLECLKLEIREGEDEL